LGKVVMRIPWLGWVTIYTEKLQGWLAERNLNVGAPIIAILIAVLVIVEFIVPLIKRKKKTAETIPAHHHNQQQFLHTKCYSSRYSQEIADSRSTHPKSLFFSVRKMNSKY
jgi:hypothetical protein